jgi:tetratricopeptide (TPR) repeat protein
MPKTRHVILLLTIILVTGGLIYATLPRRSTSLSRATKENIVAVPEIQRGQADKGEKAHELESLEAQLQQKPDHTPILFRQAQIYRETGKPAEAAKLLRQIVANEPNNSQVRLELGRVLYDLGDAPGAIAETDAILKNDPKNTDALYNLGAIYGNLNNKKLAQEYWNRAVATDPYSASADLARQALTRISHSEGETNENAKIAK